MPTLTVEGFGTVEVPAGKRLVLALEQDAKVDVLHACGGNARCTTCRVEFIDGEPARMTAAERAVLTAKGVTNARLSCQIVCDHDMSVRPGMTRESAGWDDTGPTPEPTVTPEAAWYPKEELERRGSA
ncbi:MAG: (2Fe-2S)-binding protein [Acidobacteriota bacterium]|nr:(2Fe-2S)-binding protein [Acidobacteriota bacterium]